MIKEGVVRMIKEFAVDPGLLTTWERFRYLTEKFGVSNGRLISRYPRRWESIVYAGLEGVRENDRMRIEEKLIEVKETKMLHRDHTWKPSEGWLVNAECEHDARPFHGIIGTENPRKHEQVLVYEDLDETQPLFVSNTELVVPRTPEALAAAVSPLLRISTHVVFIDPRFSPFKREIVQTLRAFLEACINGRAKNCRLDKVEFITKFQDINNFEHECQRVFSPEIPIGLVLTVTRCKEKEKDGQGFHNRYILTDRGGINFRWGLDAGKKGQTDDLSLLEPSVLKARWDDYCGDKPAFILEKPFCIQGTRKLNDYT